MSDLWVALAVGAAIGLAVGIGLGVLSARRRFGRAASLLRASADRIAEGRRDAEIPDFEDDAAESFAEPFRRLHGALLARVDEAEEERRLALSILAGMREGLVWLGPDRRIRLANETFRKTFAPPSDPIGLLLAEAVRSPAVMGEVERGLAGGGEPREAKFEHPPGSGRIFEVRVYPVESSSDPRGGGALLLFLDVTRLEALERVRRDFVANLSHELRTPLTSIRAFVETMRNDGLADREASLRFLGILERNVERMGELIDDLTDLSQIETGAIVLDLEELDAGEVAREVAAALAHRHARLGVEVRVTIPARFALRADRRRFEQILVNLVDNAMKFNRAGGRVEIGASVEGGRPVVSVADDGPGIPADSLETIFHRFYRVDRARSKEIGGTGLGLSIVKHLMRLHGGSVRVESELGRGARFVLEFPAGS